jgi:hypothetical protein
MESGCAIYFANQYGKAEDINFNNRQKSVFV